VISRSGLESNGAEGGGYLQPGDWTATIGVRHVYSHVHFSGPTENFSRAQLGTEVQSKTNIDTLTATYQLTPRISLTGTLPLGTPAGASRLNTRPCTRPGLAISVSERSIGCAARKVKTQAPTMRRSD
jgi:hypothetical protein